MKYSEGIERFEHGLGIHNRIYKSPLGRTYGKYLKLKINDMIMDSHNRNGFNEVIEFWRNCNKPKKKIWEFWK